MPLFGEIVVDEFFAGALEAVGALFESQQGGVADEDGGVGAVEHGVEVGGHGEERDVRIAPLMKEDARVGQGGAAGGVGGDGAEGWKGWLARRTSSSERTRCFGGDGAAGQDAQRRVGGEGGDGNEADVGACRRPGGRRTRRATCGRSGSAGRVRR